MSARDRDDKQRSPESDEKASVEAPVTGLAERLQDPLTATLLLDRQPGATPGGDRGAVDRALGEGGQGESHESGARLHTGATSAAAADALGARAFTAGSDIHFGSGQYSPATPSGQELLRHELTHVDQTRGVAAPSPGAWRVSDPGDAAEVAARSNAAGATAAPATIHRDEKKAPSGPSGDLRMLMALSINAEYGRKEWAGLTVADKKTISPSTIGYAIEKMQVEAVPWMKDAGVNFSKGPQPAQMILRQADPTTFTQPLKDNNLWDSFLTGLPRKEALTDEEVKKVNASFVSKAGDEPMARKLFDKTYPALHDKSYDPATLKTVAWTLPTIQRLYNVLSTYLPINGVQSVVGGFFLGTNAFDGSKWDDLGYAYYSANHVVLPAPGHAMHRKDKDGKDTIVNYDPDGTKHGMSGAGKRIVGADGKVTTGGSGAAVDPGAMLDKDGKALPDPALGHFDSSILHEVAHGVAAHSGANNWVETGGGLGAWRLEPNLESWSKELFSAKDAVPADPKNPTISADAARLYMAKGVGTGSPALPKGWKDRAQVDAFLVDPTNGYINTPLGQYWNRVKGGKDFSYNDLLTSKNTGANTADRVYVWLTRWNSGQYASYTKAALDKRVSSYSLSSPYEWFAEQYSEYYRTSRQSTRIDDDTKRKLDEINSMKWDATKNAKAPGSDRGGVLSSPTSSFDPNTKDGQKHAAGAAGDKQRAPFPW